MAIFKPIETISAKIGTIPIISGQYIYCSDTGEVFIDNSAGNRVSINKSINVKKSTTTVSVDSSSIPIDIEEFDGTRDTLLVYLNSVYLDEGTDYIINTLDKTIEVIGEPWISTELSPSIFNFVAFCNIPNTTITAMSLVKEEVKEVSRNLDENNIVLLKYENALLFYTMMVNNLNISNILTDTKILYFYLNSLWTKEMVYEAIEYGLISKEKFEGIL